MKNRKRNLTIFSGGRGNKNLFKELIKEVKFDNLSVIINGLDDGASTGEIRRLFNYQAHGISDFLKAITSLSNENNLISFLETRFPKVSNFKERLSIYKNLYGILFENSEKLLSKNHNLDQSLYNFIKEKMIIFFEYFYKNRDEIVDIVDFKLGNILFASLLIENNLDFKKSIDDFLSLCKVNTKITVLENSKSIKYLTGILKNGTLLPNEASVVLTRTSDNIKDIYQLSAPITMNQIRKLSSIEMDEKINYLESLRDNPDCNPEIIDKINNSSLIIYGSGTPYSSILPSLETTGIAELIQKNNCPKVMIANLIKETNNFLSVNDLISDIFRFLSRSTHRKLDKKKVLTHVIINKSSTSGEKNINTDKNLIKKKFPWLKIIQDDFVDPQNYKAHNGKKLLTEIYKLLD